MRHIALWEIVVACNLPSWWSMRW